MEVVSFKCPNCGGELVFDPNTQNYSCPYCNSEFSQEQIDTMQKGKQPSQESEAADSAKGQEQEEAAVYVCPNCGAEIVTDPTTAATECYYCQSPVVLSERVSGEYLPQEIIPFAIDRKKAGEIFLQNMKKKKFVPRGFFSAKQIEKISGVYFPYWWTGVEMPQWRRKPPKSAPGGPVIRNIRKHSSTGCTGKETWNLTICRRSPCKKPTGSW